MMHPDIMRLMADERLATLRHDARRPAPRPTRSTPAVDLSEIDLRLCKASDDAELEHLAALSEQPLAPGRLRGRRSSTAGSPPRCRLQAGRCSPTRSCGRPTCSGCSS